MEQTFQSMTDWDIKKLPLCSIAISVAVHVFEPRRCRLQYSSMLDAFSTFFGTHRDTKALADLDAELAICRCDFSDPVLTYLHTQPKACSGCHCIQCVRRILAWAPCLLSFLHSVLLTIEREKLANAPLKRPSAGKPKPKKWPASASALLPTGPKQMMLGSAEWFRYLGHTIPFSFVSALFDLCPSLLVDEIFHTPDVLFVAADYLVRLPRRLQASLDGELTEAGEKLPSKNYLVRHVQDTSTFFKRLISITDRIGGLLSNDRLLELFEAANRLIQLLPLMGEMGIQFLIDDLKSCARFFHHKLPKDRKMALGRELEAPECPLGDDPFHALDSIVDRFLTRPDCASRQCSRSTETLSREEGFGRCSQCRVMRFCSKDCQVQAWKHDKESPHKEICTDLAAFIAIRKDLLKRGVASKHFHITIQDVWKAGYGARLSGERMWKLHDHLVSLEAAKDEYASRD